MRQTTGRSERSPAAGRGDLELALTASSPILESPSRAVRRVSFARADLLGSILTHNLQSSRHFPMRNPPGEGEESFLEQGKQGKQMFANDQ